MKKVMSSMLALFFIFIASFSQLAHANDPCTQLAVQIELKKMQLNEAQDEQEKILEQLDEYLAQIDQAEKKAKRRFKIWIAPTVLVGLASVVLGGITFISKLYEAPQKAVLQGTLMTLLSGAATLGGTQLMSIPKRQVKRLKEELEDFRKDVLAAESQTEKIKKTVSELEESYERICQ